MDAVERKECVQELEHYYFTWLYRAVLRIGWLRGMFECAFTSALP